MRKNSLKSAGKDRAMTGFSAKERQAWIRETEASTLSSRPKGLVEAKRVFAKSLSLDEQLQLVEEIVETRAAELCQAFKNVVSLESGFGRRRNPKNDKVTLSRTPCVTFMVKRKWPEQKEDPQAIPPFLFAYWMVDGTRTLCAVPTDIESVSNYLSVEPQKGYIKTRDRQTFKKASGAATAIIKRNGDNSEYVMSCRHVFSISRHLHKSNRFGFSVLSGSRQAAKTSIIKGPLIGKPGRYSHDAQLAEVTNSQHLGNAISDISLNGWAKTRFDIQPGQTVYIIRPRSPNRVKAQLVRFKKDFQIKYGGVGPVTHRLLLEIQADSETKAGDSGSPIVSSDGKTLIGMHIAGRDKTSLAIPAWELMAPHRYSKGRRHEIWDATKY